MVTLIEDLIRVLDRTSAGYRHHPPTLTG